MLADELTVTAGDDFARRACTVPGFPKASGILSLAHPEADELRLAYETLELPADDDQRVFVTFPPTRRHPPRSTASTASGHAR
jgi:hypothetical protein